MACPPGNTCESMIMAVEMNANAAEIDVRKTADNILICHHDATIDGHEVRNLSYMEAKAMTVRLGYPLHPLKDVLESTSSALPFLIEIKEEGFETEVTDVAQECLPNGRFAFSSFNDQSVLRIKEQRPHLCAGLILGVEFPKDLFYTRYSELFPKTRLARCKADFVCPHYRLLKLAYIRRMHRIGIPVFPWTVNDPRMAQRLIQQGVDGIITDQPDLFTTPNAGTKALAPD
jgi:glycerophosphoryl diester phosphodiesterase